MSKYFTLFFSSVLLFFAVSSSVMAQQLPDPSFEDWSGAKFKNAVQPKYWHFSNVSQLGIAEFNFAQQETGHTGTYAMKVQDQDLKVAGIGETSPGYIALGQPWAHVSSISAINKATAGTYGGISWTYRPDTMTVWIKRTGPRTADENYNILYYSWIGTSEGAGYKAKDGSCAEVPDTYRFDEESDIRIALDKNECTTVTNGTQVAEGWIYERKTYENWTKIKIPIYYMNDNKPQKCNVIFSASNYPNFRANDGLYVGNTLVVDDVELIYSSAIQKVYINGKEWKGFDGSNYGVQTFALGQGVKAIPTIEAYRGAGKMTNNSGITANFPGRKLGSSEITIEKGSVDGEPCKLTVQSEDGKSKSTYLIQFVSQQSNNAKLADIQCDGTSIAGFNALVNSYNVQLPYGTTALPVVTVTKQEDVQQVDIAQATSLNGSAVITVTAQDGVTKNVYTINFSVGKLSDNTLKDILVNGKSVNGFAPTKTTYTVELPLSTTKAPEVTPVSAYEAGAQTITIVSNTLDVAAQSGQCKITVSAPAAQLMRTYTLNYKITKSSNSALSMIYLDGVALADFDAARTSYDVLLSKGTTKLPVITWKEGDEYQQVSKMEGGVDGTTRLLVTAGSGATTTYRLNFSVERSTSVALAGIQLDGVPLEDFDAETLSYAVTLPAGTKSAPVVTAVAEDDEQSIRVVNGGLDGQTRIIVTAGDGVSTRTYVLTFEVEKSANAFLEMIYLDGRALPDFNSEVFNYRFRLSNGQNAPRVTVSKYAGQQVIISQPSSVGTARIEVVPEVGTPNVYLIEFYDENEVVYPTPNIPEYIPSREARAQMIYINNVPVADFDKDVDEYTIELDRTATEQPVLSATPMSNKAFRTIITQGEAGANASVRIVAEDTMAVKDYIFHFPLQRSTNAAPENIDVDGRFVFDKTQLHYDVLLTYGEDFPEVYVTKAEDAQRVDISYVKCGNARTVEVVVTAADGKTQQTYTISISVSNHPENVLRSLVAGNTVLDYDALNAPGDLFIDVDYDATSLGIAAIEKNFKEQYVVVNDGGADRPTTIWVYAGRSNEEAPKVYTLVPRRAKNPLLLTDLMVDGTTIADFNPERFDYILSASATPVVTGASMEGTTVDEVLSNPKRAQLRVSTDDADGPIYTVWFYYPGDVTFGGSFEDWTDNRPNGWHSAVDASTSGDKGSYNPKDSYAVSTDATQGSSSANLKTAYLLTSAEAMPGILSLSEQSVKVGAYYVFGHTASTLSFGNGIKFRNTPDSVALDYKTIANNKVTGWHWKWMVNGETTFDYEGNYNTKNQWLTISQRLTYAADFIPGILDIRINPAHSETLSDYYVGTSGASNSNRFTSSMLVDNLRMFYNSRLTGASMNGTALTLSSTMSGTVDSEFWGLPSLAFTKGAGEQATAVTWSDEVAGVRTATIRNYGEDLSYTDYALTVTRPISENSAFTTATTDYANMVIKTVSPYATVATAIEGDKLCIKVRAEKGDAFCTGDTILLFVHDTVRTTMPAVLPEVHDSIATETTQRQLNDNLDLKVILIGSDTLRSYDAYQLSYTLYAPKQSVVTPVQGDEQQTVSTEDVTLSDGSSLTYIYVRSGEGNVRVYSVRRTHTAPSSDATLSMIYVGEDELSGFSASQLSYSLTLPPHSALPDVSAVLNHSAATIAMQREGNTIHMVVTAEDGVTQQTYSIACDIPASDYSTLSMILLGGSPVENFDSNVFTYAIELPVGTTLLPELEYVKLEAVQTVSVDTVALSNYVGSYTLTVTAEDGVHQSVYRLNLSVLRSSNALLQSVMADGVEVSSFYSEMDEPMEVKVPYGAAVPTLTWTKSEEAQTVVLASVDALSYTITVTAEDGVTTKVYEVRFVMLPSMNAELALILLNGDSLSDFDSETYEYDIMLAYDAVLPEVSWTLGDEQQTAVCRWEENTCIIEVTAGDGETVAEYVLNFIFLQSDNALLMDLKVFGKSLDGFRADSTAYALVYPWTTRPEELAKVEDVLATPEDANATVTVSVTSDHVIMVTVLAADGITTMVYTVEQTVEPNARLKMIYVNGTEMRDFRSDSLNYVFELPITASVADVDAVPEDSLASVDMSVVVLDDTTYIYCTAADGVTIETYTLYLYRSSLDPSQDVDMDDVAFLPIAGTNTFLAVTSRSNVQVGIYDYMGHLLLLSNVPPCEPNFLEIEVDEEGNEKITHVYPGATGVEFTVPQTGIPYLYVFYKATTNKRFTKGGKVMIK